MRKRTWISLAVVAAVLAALAVTVYLRKKAPPEVARLLPEADAIVYFNLQPLRAATHFDRHPVVHDPSYQAFIDATGVQFERDLDEVAFAVHRMPNPDGPNGSVAYSEVFRGRFDAPRLTAYLAAQAGGEAGESHYAGHLVYSIAHDGRTVRVVILGYDLVAVSNTPTAEQIHSIIDRYHSSASPFSGDTLLSRYYSQVPLLSDAWGIGALGLPFAGDHQYRVFGLPLPLPVNATFVASVRYLGKIRFRLEEIAPSARAAQQSAEVARLALGMLRSAQISTGPNEAGAKQWNALLAGVKIEQKGKRAILTAVAPVSLVKSLLKQQGTTPGGTQP